MSEEIVTTELEAIEDTDFAIVLRNLERLAPGTMITFTIVTPDGTRITTGEMELDPDAPEPSTICPRCGFDRITLGTLDTGGPCPRCGMEATP